MKRRARNKRGQYKGDDPKTCTSLFLGRIKEINKPIKKSNK